MGLFNKKNRKSEPLTREDAGRIGREIGRSVTRNQRNEKNSEQFGSVVRKIGKGFNDIARSLNTPSSNRRPRIAQMPGRRGEMDIVRKADLRSIKAPWLRGRDIRGRKEE